MGPMMDTTSFESRRNKILDFIIQMYIETAAPVGSHEVCRRFHLRLSPATVRNVMGDLEDQALLTHPHTSAGRIPTDRGYRYYVDTLMVPQTLTLQETQALAALGHSEMDDPLELLRAASRLLAELTGEASVVMAPRVPQSVLKRIDLIPVDPHRVLGLVMTTEGLLKHTWLELDELVDAAELARVSQFLNDELSGQLLSTIHERLQQSLMDAGNAFTHLYKRAHELWLLGEFLEGEVTLFVDGVSHLLAQPEFRHAQRSRPVLEILELQQPLATLLGHTMEQAHRWSVIGHEHQDPALAGCSVVSAPYRAGNRMAGALGVVGPTRMSYAHVVSLVEGMAAVVSQMLERFVA